VRAISHLFYLAKNGKRGVKKPKVQVSVENGYTAGYIKTTPTLIKTKKVTTSCHL
jgi:hypothetical protein